MFNGIFANEAPAKSLLHFGSKCLRFVVGGPGEKKQKPLPFMYLTDQINSVILKLHIAFLPPTA